MECIRSRGQEVNHSQTYAVALTVCSYDSFGFVSDSILATHRKLLQNLIILNSVLVTVRGKLSCILQSRVMRT